MLKYEQGEQWPALQLIILRLCTFHCHIMFCHFVRWLVSDSVGRSVGRRVGRLVGRSVGSPVYRSGY